MSEYDFLTLSVKAGVFIADDGEEIPVLSAKDEDGNDCDLATAVLFTAGPDKRGHVLTVDMRITPTTH